MILSDENNWDDGVQAIKTLPACRGRCANPAMFNESPFGQQTDQRLSPSHPLKGSSV